MERRLAAILSADVVGYSRLMAADEAGTLDRLKSLRKDLVDPKIAEHHGRIVKLMGDGALVEFASIVDAVSCAVEIQQAVVERNADERDDWRMELRIGVNLGDVIVEGDDIYGDGVNVAARLQEIAEPGGISISRPVYDQVKNRLELDHDYLGERQLKNIPEPVRVYRVRLAGSETAPIGAGVEPKLALPDKPSIAVLPFENMSGDPEQEYFSDGISEDIITDLSKFRSLFVIARNSSFTFKGQAIEIKEVGRRLGVRYVVEGSVRRAGNRVRISAQLIDAPSDAHLWAERYDRDLEDIFAIQDDVTRAIVAAIEPELGIAERQRARRKAPDNLDAWEWYQRGLWHVYRFTAEENARAVDMFRRAIEIDASFAPPYAGLAYALYFDVILGYVDEPGGRLPEAHEAARTAVRLDDKDAFGHVALGRVLVTLGELDAAIAATDTAIAFNPNLAVAHQGRGLALCFAGRSEEAIDALDEALRLSPRDPLAWSFMMVRSVALILLRRHDEALEWARKSQRQPNADGAVWPYALEASALAHLGRIDEARAALERALAIKPDFSTAFIDRVMRLRNPDDRAHYLDGLRKAGLPE